LLHLDRQQKITEKHTGKFADSGLGKYGQFKEGRRGREINE
jgi:hypothetical protein